MFICTEFEGEPKCRSNEMYFPFWMEPDTDTGMFPPFAESLKLLNNQRVTDELSLTNGGQSDIITSENKIQGVTEDGGPGSGRYPEGSGKLEANPNISAMGANVFPKGFKRGKAKSHLEKHLKDYPEMTQEQYEQTALELIQKSVGGDIHGYKTETGIVR